MKFYVAWYPESHGNADPEYWKWFEPDGILVALSNLRGRALRQGMMQGLHCLTGYQGEIFLDGGAFGYPNHISPYSQIQILSMQTWLRASLISHLDRPFVKNTLISEDERWSVLRSTIENAKVATRWKRTHNDPSSLVLVIQGWDLPSLRLCARKLAVLRADRYAIGSLIGLPPGEVIRRVHDVRQIIGPKPDLHIFGVSRFQTLESLVGLADSFDSSAPIKASFFKEVVTRAGCRTHVDAIFANHCQCPVCFHNPRLIALKGRQGVGRRLNHLRAIHNACIMTEYAHTML